MGNKMKIQGNKLEKILVNLIKWGVYLSLLTPLVFSERFFYGFIVPKTVYFRIIVEITLVLYLVLILNFPKYRPKFNVLLISLSIFVLITIVSSLLGVDFQRSFWSTYEREVGIFTLLHLYSYFIILVSVFKNREEWERLLLGSVFVGAICSLTAIVGGTLESGSMSKGGGTVGNTSFLASYLLFNVFFALYLFDKKKFSLVGILSLLSLVIMMVIIFQAGARAAALSFFGGLAFLFLSLLFFSGRKKLKILSFVLSLTLIVFFLGTYFYNSQFQTIVNSHLNTMKARYLVWGMALKGFLEKPILGWGLENFNFVFAKHFDPRLFLGEYGGEIWFDRTHNILLEKMINSGVVGLVSYLSVLFVAVYYLFKKSIKKENVNGNLILISLLLAYFIQNMTVFDIISSHLTFFLLLAFIYYLNEENGEEREFSNFSFSLKGFVYFLALIFIGFSFYFGNIQTLQGSANALNFFLFSETEDKIYFYNKSLKPIRYNFEISRQFVNIIPSQSGNKESLKEAYSLIEKEIEKNLEESPLTLSSYYPLARTYLRHYRLGEDNNKLELAENTIQKAIEISPRNPQGYWLLADLRAFQNRIDEQVRSLEMALNLEPRIARSHWFLFVHYFQEEDYEKCWEVIEKAEQYNLNLADWEPNLVLHVYEYMNQYEKVIPIYQEILIEDSSRADIWFKLSVAFFNLGEQEKAQATAQRALELNPEMETQMKDLIDILLKTE